MDKKGLIEQMNEAFASCDLDFLMENVTSDIEWEVVGENKISGLDEFRETLEKMKKNGPMNITVNEIIVEKNRAVVEGVVQLKNPNRKRKYAFCDIYVFKKNVNKVKGLRTYITKIVKIK